MNHQTQIVETTRGPVEYSHAGNGDAILYFHGTGITSDGMMPFEYELVRAGFRLVMPNRPGYGNTPLASNESIRDCSDMAAALLDSMGLQRVAVMGSSGGGTFALSFALHHPSRCQSLTLLCPQLHRWSSKEWMPHSGRWVRPFLSVSYLRKILMVGHRMQCSKTNALKFLRMEAGARFESVKTDQHALGIAKASVEAMKKGVKYPGFENDMRLFVSEDAITDGDELLPPSMIIHDPVDPLAPVAQIDWFCHRVPSCRRINVETAGHLVWAGRDYKHVHDTRVEFITESIKAAC